MSQTLRIKLSLYLTYFVFAILLNSVGTVILQVIHFYDVSKPAASVLEGFKDLPIAIVSFLVASFLPRLGFRNAMVIGLSLVTLACIAMPLVPTFWTTKILFLIVGSSFALVKVSVYAVIGQIAEGKRAHASTMNTIEGIFMVGVLFGYWLFGYFIDPDQPDSPAWLDAYWLIAGICIANILLLLSTPFHASPPTHEDGGLRDDFVDMLKLMVRPLVFVFVLSAFMYVLIEQGIGTWLPTFNNEVLKLPTDMSVQVTSIFAATLAIGRLSAGVVMRRIAWYPFLNGCIIALAALILLSLPLTQGVEANPDIDWFSAPIAAYIFPLIGLFMAPIYPAINSVMLSALPTRQHAAMTGLIVIFSALGGTTGSIITGYIFSVFDGQTAFYFSLLPVTIILIALFFFKRETDKMAAAEEHPDLPPEAEDPSPVEFR